MSIIAFDKNTVDNSKAHKKDVSKVRAPNLATRNKKRTSRTSIKAPSIPNKIKTPTLPSVGLSDPNEDVGSILRPTEIDPKDKMKKVKCDQFNCYINEDGTEAHIRHNSNPSLTKIDDNGETVEVLFNSNDWVFSQTTAVASVDIIEGFRIKPETAKFVNNNGNAFSDRIVQKYYKTFIGAHNYKNHLQDPAQSYGIILDAVLREVPIPETETSIFYIDCLIATNRHKDDKWAKAIENGVVKFVSMGAESSSFRCTNCGNIATRVQDFCDHFKYHKGKYYIDSKGRKLRIAHLVEDYKNAQGQGYVEFIELSYLDINPAFQGASQAHILRVPTNTDVAMNLPIGYLSKSAFRTWVDSYKIKKEGQEVDYNTLIDKVL